MMIDRFVVDRENHEYHYDGVKMDSVTDMLSIFGAMDHVPPERLAIASKFGKAVHLTTEYHDRKILKWDSVSDSILPYLDGWENFLLDTGFKIEDIEISGFHKIHKYAYTIDRTGIYKKRKTILDIKSGSVFSKTTDLQLGGYLGGLNSWIKLKRDQYVNRITVWLNPKFPSGYKIIEHKNKNDINTFLCVVNSYKWGKANGYYGQ